jgi:hypothetical protein
MAYDFFNLAELAFDSFEDNIDPIFGEIDPLIDAGIEMILDVEELVDKCKLDFDSAIQGYKQVRLFPVIW